MANFDKIVVIGQKTALEELIDRFNTREQARFYLEHQGASFAGYEAAHATYKTAVEALKKALPKGVRQQFVDRAFLPNFLFGEKDLAVVIGRDGLVVNAAKYLPNQPIVGVNPDPARNDGVLLPFSLASVGPALERILAGKFECESITMAEAALNNGQKILAVNDLFIGVRSHTSARYRLTFGDRSEEQSSSGIIVSTGAGSTGWFRSILAGAVGVAGAFGKDRQLKEVRERYRFERTAPKLCFCVREPFASSTTQADLVFGWIEKRKELTIASQMPTNGVIFSDGIEADYLEFNSGTTATVRVAPRKVRLVKG